MTTITKEILPFRIKTDSEVSGGYSDKLHNEFYPNTEIINYHLDNSNGKNPAGDFSVSLQSPYTERWIGGYSYRHVPLNDGNDDATNRPEGWHVEFRPGELELFPHSKYNSPPAYWTRNLRAKSPVSIYNIKTTEDGVGNYGENYEFLQTSGRRNVNNLIVDGFEATSELTTQFINDLTYQDVLLFSEDFSAETVGVKADTTEMSSSTLSYVKQRVADVPGKKYVVLDNSSIGVNATAFLQTKNRYSGKIKIKYTVLKNQDSTAYDPSGLNLEKPDAGEDLVLEYSTDTVSWTTLKTIMTGSNTVIASILEQTFEDEIELATDSYIRFRELPDSGFLNDHYAITDVSFMSVPANYAVKQNEYSLPDLTNGFGSRSVIVERFNAPGSKEESSRGSLDREGEEMSPNIPLPFRNHYIRKSFYSDLSQSTPQFGGTIHQVHRNRLVRGDKESFDNGFVSHPIPRTDIQYSWITASATTTAAELAGYATEEDSIQFNSSSLVFIDGQEKEIDNLYINSLVKDEKTVDITNNIFSIEGGLSASFSEYANSNYSFATWESIRNGEKVIPRLQRKNNILTIGEFSPVLYEDNGKTSQKTTRLPNKITSYSEPAVSFKYKPLAHEVLFSGEDSTTIIEYDHAVSIAKFSNEELNNKLGIKENEKNTFYDVLAKKYKNPTINGINYVAHEYKEIIWPKEMNTGLDKVRKRKEYYLDKPGLDRDGYDRQLGTQRVFWRENSLERKRSKNSDGGYYSTINYLSTQETGSNFGINGTTTIFNETQYSYSSSFSQSNEIDNGIYNSISLMDNSVTENLLYTSSLRIVSASSDPLIFADQIINTSFKRGYHFDNAGEFNHSFVDFYGSNRTSGSTTLNDLGAVYRSSFYKSLLTTKQYEFNSQEDQADTLEIIRTEDDEVYLNPKLKYTAFVGGGELNISSYVQNNFSDSEFTLLEDFQLTSSLTTSSFGNQWEKTQALVGSSVNEDTIIYPSCGEFASNGTSRGTVGIYSVLGDLSVVKVQQIESNLTDQDVHFGLSTSISNTDSGILAVSAFITASTETGSVHVFSGSTASGWQEIDKLTSGQLADLYGGFVKVSSTGQEIFVSALAADSLNGQVHVYESGSTGWTEQQIITLPSNPSEFPPHSGSATNLYFGYNIAMSADDQKMIISAPVHNNTGSVLIYDKGVSQWDFEDVLTYPSHNLQTNITFGWSCDISANGNVIVISAPLFIEGTKSGRVLIYEYIGSSWVMVKEEEAEEDSLYFGLSCKISPDNKKIVIADYEKDYFYISGSNGWVKTGEKNVTNQSTFQGISNHFLSEDVFVAISKDFGSELTKHIYEYTGSLYLYNLGQNQTIDSGELFEQTFTEDDITFSTLDNGLYRKVETESGKKPFYDSYDDYLESVRGVNKDYSIIPEFRISDHLEYYIDEQGKDFTSKNRELLFLDGAESVYKSSTSRTSSLDVEFLNSYTTSDILKDHDFIKEDNRENSELDKVKITVSGIKKLLPYNGFYPQDRAAQIANLYSEYIDNNLAGGTYNVSYENAALQQSIFEHVESDSSLTQPSSISVEEFSDKYYVAVAYATANDSSGLVKLFSSSAGDFFNDTWGKVAEYTGSAIQDSFGASVKLIKTSDELHLFITDYSLSQKGALYQVTSSNGTQWTPLLQASSSAGNYITGSINSLFGNSLDAIYDSSSDTLIVGIGAYKDDKRGSNGGAVYTVTASGNHSDWSTLNVVDTGTTYSEIGTSISLLATGSNTNYSFYYSAPFSGDIYVRESADGVTWGSRVDVVNNSGYTGIGLAGIKAEKLGNKSYLFYSEPFASIGSKTYNGKASVIVSDEDHDWAVSNTTVLLEGKNSYDYVCGTGTNMRAISTTTVNDEKLFYSFGVMLSTQNGFYQGGSVYFGSSDDGETFKTGDELTVKEGDYRYQYLGAAVEMIQSGSVGLSVFADKSFNYGSYTSKNITLSLNVESEESQKAFKHAALEPVMAPGILFNTVKSGIAVDWPCTTGSVSHITTEDNIIINKFLPEPKIMSSFNGSMGLYNIQGNIKSDINYRIPFDNLIYPKEIFEEKNLLSSNVKETYVVGEGIPDTSFVKTFLSGCYTYGGYEPYISPADTGDIYGQSPKRFSIPFVYKKKENDNGLYTMAMSNYLAETVNFFLEQGKMVTFESKPDSQWPDFVGGREYYLDVILEKSSDFEMIKAYHSEKHPLGPNGEKMNGRYFGYPTNKTTKEIWIGEEFSEEQRRTMFNDPAYAPYTPPYFEGRARARLSFVPENSGKYTLEEVFSKLQIQDILEVEENSWEIGSDAEVNKMTIGSSIDLFGTVNSVNVSLSTDTTSDNILSRDTTRSETSKKWIISPKFECPVLDFNDKELEPYSNEYLKTSGFGIGMWSNYGSIPTGDKGIKLSLSYPFARQNNTAYEFGVSRNNSSLLKHVGFEANSKKVGQISTTGKIIKEAVVLVPYVENYDAERTTNKIFEKFYFLKLDKEKFEAQKVNFESKGVAVQAGQFGFDKQVESTSVTKMIKSMKEYVIPPEFDFLNNQNINPFAMYLFEFDHLLTKRDLADIWQGVSPEIATEAEFQDIIIEHESSEIDFFEGKGIPNNLKWLVFKVKKKAIIDYGEITVSTKDDARFRSELKIGQQEAQYGYNWPYDYFSLVEFAKVELSLKYKKK